MSFAAYLEKNKEIQRDLLNFLEDTESSDYNFELLLKNISKSNIQNNKREFKLFLSLLLSISINHYREINFFERIEQILKHFEDDIKNHFTNSEIFDIFKQNRRIILFLVEEKIIPNDDTFIDKVLTQNKEEDYYFNYFYQGMMSDCPDDFKKNQKIGENETLLCSLIRQDSIEDFISYINRNSISMSFKIKPTIFETNQFLLKHEPTLIEYAAFYGSIQVFKYLLLNKSSLDNSLWIYAIHGKNPEIIHLIEENQVLPPNKNYQECFKESVICHHNDIAEYILTNYLSNKMSNVHEIIDCYNFSFIQEDLIDKTYFYYFCMKNCYTFVKLILEEKNIDVNMKIKEISCCISNDIFI